MQPRTTAILLVVALALGAFVYFYEIAGEGARKEAEEASRRLFPDVASEAIDQLSMTTGDGIEMRARREGEHWTIDRPFEFPGDDVNLNAMATTLAGLKSESTLDSPEQPEVYGLGASAKRVHFRAGEQDHSLRIGKQSPLDEKRYVATFAEPNEIHLLPGWRVNAFSSEFAELRDRRVIVVDRAAVEGIRVRWSDAGVELEKREGDWVIVDPAVRETRADPEVVDRWLSDLAALRASGFIDEGQEDRDSDFDAPILSVELIAGEERSRMQVGSVVDEGLHDLRGRVEGTLYRVVAERISELPQGVFAFQFKQISKFNPERVGAVEISFPAAAKTVRVDRGVDGFAAASEMLVPGVAERLIAELADLKAVAIVTAAMEPQELAVARLSPPEVSFRVFDRSEPPEPIAEIRLGELDPELGIIARAADRETIYRIDAALAEQIPVSLEAYESRFVSAPLPPISPSPEPEPVPEPSEAPGVQP